MGWAGAAVAADPPAPAGAPLTIRARPQPPWVEERGPYPSVDPQPRVDLPVATTKLGNLSAVPEGVVYHRAGSVKEFSGVCVLARFCELVGS